MILLKMIPKIRSCCELCDAILDLSGAKKKRQVKVKVSWIKINKSQLRDPLLQIV